MANDATIPIANLYVESAVVESLADALHAGRVLVYDAPRQAGKSTDALAVCRRLRERGIQVQCMLASPHVLLWQQPVCISHASSLLLHSVLELQWCACPCQAC